MVNRKSQRRANKVRNNSKRNNSKRNNSKRNNSKRNNSKRRTKKVSKNKRGGAVRLPAEYFGGNSGRYSANPLNSYDTAYGTSVGVSMGTVRGSQVGPNLAPGPNSKNMTGGAVRLPSEYFGGNSGRYSANPLSSYDTAYGSSVGVSMGSVRGDVVGPNLAPGPNSSGQMTGGSIFSSSSKSSKRKEYLNKIKENDKKILTHRKNAKGKVKELRRSMDLSNTDGVNRAKQNVDLLARELENIRSLRSINASYKQYV
jgi:hypothetical protein